ncbi:MAG: ABC transporter ATP-binding protein [Patescibacteria group bacterium]|nr:ABC transporter ATP-binding protein [Patescibacteria group bacterium]
MNTIEVKNLKKYFGKTKAVDDISFEVRRGEIFGFLGPNGAGKTTTIRCLLGFIQPTEGSIKILDHDLTQKNFFIKEKVGYLSGDVRLYDGWTGEDHIKFLESLRRGQKSISQKLVSDLNFNPKIKFKSLSSGNKQKLGLILALSFQPELIIMDEPTVGLDPLLQNTIYEILEEFKKQGTTIFMSSHNLAEVDRLCNRVGIIKDGKLMTIEGIQELKDKRMHVVKVYLNGPFNQQDFVFDSIEIQKELPGGLELGVRGDINPLIQKLGSYNVRELEITHASLEEIFLEFYGASTNYLENKNQNKSDLLEIPKME